MPYRIDPARVFDAAAKAAAERRAAAERDIEEAREAALTALLENRPVPAEARARHAAAKAVLGRG